MHRAFSRFYGKLVDFIWQAETPGMSPPLPPFVAQNTHPVSSLDTYSVD